MLVVGGTIAEMVEAHITRNGTTGAAFAALLGVTPAAVSRWRNGRQLPERHRLPDLAALLGQPVAQLREQWDVEDAARGHTRLPSDADRLKQLDFEVM